MCAASTLLRPVPALELAADDRLGVCAACTLLRRELDEQQRIVHANDGVVAYVPDAARWPYEVHVVMRDHLPSLTDCSPAALRDLAQALQAVTRGSDELFARPFPYVMVVHQAPTDGRREGHLHVCSTRRCARATSSKYIAGAERSAGAFIMDVMPEDSARAPREAIAGAA